MEIRGNRFQGHEDVLEALAADSTTASDINEFCTLVCDSLRQIIDIDTLILFAVKDSENLEMVASSGKPYARLDEGKYLKRHRKTPVTDAIRLQVSQVWSDARKMMIEYPDLVEWPRIMHAVVAIPVVEKEESVAGCVFVLRREFAARDHKKVEEILEKVTAFIYSIYRSE